VNSEQSEEIVSALITVANEVTRALAAFGQVTEQGFKEVAQAIRELKPDK
jgi:hypothetical protein